jgi:hypothetical protein
MMRGMNRLFIKLPFISLMVHVTALIAGDEKAGDDLKLRSI